MAYEPLIVYLGTINTRRKVTSGSLEYYYFDIYPPLEIPKYPSGSSEVGLDVFGPEGSDTVLVFFEPNHEELFFRNHYEVLENNDENSRRSKKYLTVDNKSSQLGPTNIQIISRSLEANRRILFDRDLFAELQDSNYESKSWNIPRYEGSKLSFQRGIIPTLYLVNFQGIVFEKSITVEEVRELYTRTSQQSIYYYTPANVEPNGLFYYTDYNSIIVGESIIYLFSSKNVITTLYDSKILDLNNGSLYTTDNEGKVIEKATIIIPTPTPTPTSTLTPTLTPTPTPTLPEI